MQIYNLTANNEKFQIGAGCTLEQLNYALLIVLDQSFALEYSFNDKNHNWNQDQAKTTTIAQLENEFKYQINDQSFSITVASANITDDLYPKSSNANMNGKLHQDFLVPRICHSSDFKAIKVKLASLLDIFPEQKIIASASRYFHYTIDNGAYCLDVFDSLQDLSLALNSREEGIFKKSLSLVFIPDEDYFDVSEFDFGEVYEIADSSKLLAVSTGVLLLERDLPALAFDSAQVAIDFHSLALDLTTTTYNPGKLQIALEPSDNDDVTAFLNFEYESIFDQRELHYQGFEQLCQLIQRLTIEKINQLGIVARIEVNDENLYHILLPLSRFNIEISRSDFTLVKDNANPFENGNFDGATAQELLSKLLNKYGYQGLTQKIMSTSNLNMMDLMSLATKFKNQDLSLDDPKTRELLQNLYEAFKDDL